MAETTIQEQIVRETPQMEAYRAGLIQSSKELVEKGLDLPAYEVAAMTPQQIAAIQQAGQGVGAYKPYLENAASAFGKAASGYGGAATSGIGALGDVRAAAAKAGGIGAAGLASLQQGVDLSRLQGTAGMDYLRDAAEASRDIRTSGLESVEGAAGLATALSMGGAGAYDPRSAQAYMNPYQEEVTRKAIEEMSRQAGIQQQSLSAQAVKAGAFGGSREGVQRAELGRNLADVQSKRILEDYYANYSQAQNAAMKAFQDQQSRQQNSATTALGAGQAIGAQATSAAGQELAGGQALGTQSTNLAGQTLTGGQALGTQATNLASQALAGGQAAANTGIAAGQLQTTAASGIASLGQSTADLGKAATNLAQADTSFLYNIGQQQQTQAQKELDASRATQLQDTYAPYQGLSFISDIYKGGPSSQQTVSSTTAPSASLVSQVAGLGTTALAASKLMGS